MLQPLRTTQGYITLNGTTLPVYVAAGSYSMLVLDKKGRVVISLPNVVNALLNQIGAGGAALIGFDGTTLDQVLKLRVNRIVDSIAALRGLSSAIYQRAFVTGYFVPHDGGGGNYQFDPNDTTSSDNGGTIIVASDGGRWKLSGSGTVSTKQFGVFATGDAGVNTTQLQAALNSGAGRVLFDCRNTSDIININAALVVPLQMEIVSNTRWAGMIQQTALNQPIFTVASSASDVSIDNIHLGYSGTPVSGADAIQLNGCFSFAAHGLWISSCWNGVYMNQGGNHAFIDIRIFAYENCALLLSAVLDVNVSAFRFSANDSIKGRLGGIRLQGPCEGCTFSQGDVTLGQYGLTTSDFGSNARGQAPYFNRFVAVHFDSAKINPAFLQSLCDSDFVGCWFASAGHDEAVGFGSALANPGAYITKCTDLRFIGGQFENNGGPGAQVYADSARVSFTGGVTFKHNQYSRSADAEAIQVLANANDWRVNDAKRCGA
ncbi:hypothetical protein [Burkholderia thailandensis]|uniref:hypothetical protein n=1 Tax=Burkholderia thailandensis TaxID=57975 RepID=UPI003F91446D